MLIQKYIILSLLICLSFNGLKGQTNDSSYVDSVRKVSINHYFRGAHSKALKNGLELLKIYESNSDSENIAWTYNLLGSVYSSRNKIKKSVYYLRRGLKLSQSIKDTNGVIRAMNNLATTYGLGHHSDSSLILMRKGLKWSIDFQDSSDIALFYYNLATYYSTLDQYDQTRLYLDSSIYYCDALRLPRQLAIRYNLYAFTLLEEEAFDVSETYNLKSLEIYKAAEDTFGLVNIYNKLGRLYTRTGDYQKSIEYLSKSIELNNNRFDEYLSDSYGLLTLHYEALNMHKKALEFAKLNKSFDDSIRQLEENKQWEMLELIESHEKLRIKQEKEQIQVEKQLKEEQVKQYFISIILILIILLVLAYSYIKLKKSKDLLQVQKLNIDLKNNQLEEAVKNKEVLLKEIHHRVKNNLQMISSLLGMQEMMVEDEATKKVLEQGQARIEAMSLIHQQLYQSADLSNISLEEYFQNLLDYFEQISHLSKEVHFKLKVEIENILDIDQIIPLGLIISELISNAYKYAFDGQDDPEIKIELQENSKKSYLLSFKDNGLGFPENFNIQSSNSLGTKIVDILSKQIGGEIKLYNQQGAIVEIQF